MFVRRTSNQYINICIDKFFNYSILFLGSEVFMKCDEFIKEIEIDSYEDLIKKIYSSNFNRKEYIFRGIGNVKYDLIPKALRRNEFDQAVINKYISSDFIVNWKVENNWEELLNDSLKNFKIDYEDYCDMINDEQDTLILDKYGFIQKETDKKILCSVGSKKELQIKRELHLLLRFFNWIDKTGLEINVNTSIRSLIHENIKFTPKSWPHPDFFEIISLAQHYGLPTEALDWSYRFEVGLYFAVKNILKNNRDDGVLWALNYKLLENKYLDKPLDNKILFYRPQYYLNNNLRAQKGLFTFVINEGQKIDYRPLDKILFEDRDEFNLNPNENIFYKFIIPNKIKADILKELYRDGWSEKFMFPGYIGVVKSMKNKVKSDDYIYEPPNKKSILMSFSKNEIDKIKEGKNVTFRKFRLEKPIDKIFIYSRDSKKIYGYYNSHHIINNTIDHYLQIFKEQSLISEAELLDKYGNVDFGITIQLSDLNLFKYPFKLHNYNETNEYSFLEKVNSLKLLLNF